MTELQWTFERTLADLEGTQRLARRLADVLAAGDLLVLTGGLGAGKTTFTQALGEALGVEGRVSSPTFVLARVHRSTGQGPDLVHVDAYRTDADGLESLDLPSTASTSVTVVEWGRGLVEEALAGQGGSWVDLELLGPDQGRAASGEPGEAPSSSPGGAGPSADAAGAGSPGAAPIITDFAESEADLLGAPRRAVLRGYGPRWAEPPQL